jgi:hypothetical protein
VSTDLYELFESLVLPLERPAGRSLSAVAISRRRRSPARKGYQRRTVPAAPPASLGRSDAADSSAESVSVLWSALHDHSS